MVRLIYHPAYSTYDLGADHPFSPLRVSMVVDLLGELGHPLDFVRPEAATLRDVLTVHGETYVRAVAALARGEGEEDPAIFGLGTPDNPLFPGMHEAASLICGGTLEAVRIATEGPPAKALHLGGGLHHARPSMASGFCIYNDLAIAIRQALDRGLRVAYLDLDVHHGDGVQDIFYDTDRVLTISLHESGQYLFPGTGSLHEMGSGPGRGRAVNLPLEPFTEDESYLECFDAVVPEALAWFRPDLLLVQAGADAHFQDPLADLMLTTRGYEKLFRRVMALSDSFAGGRLAVTLGGGYSLSATPRVWTVLSLVLLGLEIPSALHEAWRQRWERRIGAPVPAELPDASPAFPPIPRREEIARHNRHTASRVLEAARRLWT